LYIAKKVVETQGGKIIFESKVSVGSIFGFRFSKDLINAQQTSNPESESSTENKKSELTLVS